MSATEILRRMLNERGVEYTANERDTQWWPKDNPAGVLAENSRYPHDTLDVYGLTPEQAIAATLGSSSCTNDCTNSERTGTCHDAAGKQMAFFACSACGATIERKHPRFCHGCGRKVVDE